MFRRISLVLPLLFGTLFCLQVPGQSTTATISGTVKDDSGAVLPGVSIAVRNLETGAIRAVITDDEGRYNAPSLATGDYEVKAELGGFQTVVRSGIKLTLGREAIVDFALKVGEISERVVVTGEASLVETTNATLTALVDDRNIRDLPLNGRNFVELALLQPGVVSFQQRSAGQLLAHALQININGAGARSNSFLLDGANMNDYYNVGFGTIAGTSLGVETIQEYRVVTNSFSAEYGRSMGGVISSVTKSGTNELHGSIFEFLRNSALDARNFFDPSRPPAFKRNQFGFALGGPIKTDRTFFTAPTKGCATDWD